MRDPGFYWLTRRDTGRRGPDPTIARWDGDAWTFIGALWLIAEDELDEDGERVMDRYVIGDRIPEPPR